MMKFERNFNAVDGISFFFDNEKIDAICVGFYEELKNTKVYVDDLDFDFTPSVSSNINIYGVNPLFNYLVYLLRVAFLVETPDVGLIERQSSKIRWYSAYNIYNALLKTAGESLELRYFIYFMSMIEFDRSKSIWRKKLDFLLRRLTIEELFSISDFHSYSDQVNRYTLFCKNDLLAKHKTSLLSFHEEAERVISLLINEGAKKNKKVVKDDIENICFVVSRPFPIDSNIENNSHWIIAKYYLLLIDVYNKKINKNGSKINVSFIITGERSFSTPFSEMNPIKDDIISSNFDLLHSEIESLQYCYCGKEKRASSKSSFLNDAFDKLCGIDPDVVVFMGGTYDSKLFRYKTYLHYPVAVLSTTSSIDNAYGRPDDFCDSIRAVHESHVQAIIDFGIKSEKVTTFTKPEFNSLETGIDNSSWSWPKGKSISSDTRIVMLTPLTGGRILRWLSSLSDDELSSFIKLFTGLPYLSWVIVGQKELQLEKFFKGKAKLYELYKSRRIVIVDFTNNIKGLLNLVDFLFVPALGGGTTINMASTLKKPSIIPVGSDGQTLVNDSAMYNDINHLINIITKVCNDRQYYDFLSEESYKLSNKRRDLVKISSEFKGFLLRAVKNHKNGVGL